MESPMLGISAVARLLGRCQETVRRLDRSGDLPAMRDSGGRRLWLRAQVEHYIQKRETKQ